LNKDLSIIILGRVFQVLIALVSIRALTTFLSPEEVGNYYIILALLAFFNLVLLNPPGMYFSRHILHWQKSKNLLNALIVFVVWIVIVSIISIPISISVYYFFGYETKFNLFLFLIYIFMAILIGTIHRNVMYETNTLGYRKEFVIYLISTLFIGLICSVSAVYFYYNIALGWLMGVVLSEALMIHLIFKFFIQKNKFHLKKIKLTLTQNRVKKILSFSLPIGLTTFLMWGHSLGYRFIVDYQYSAEVLGYIAIGLGVATAVFGVIENITTQYFNPIFLKNILDAPKKLRAEAWNNMAKQIVPIYIFTLFFVVTMSEVLISILADKKFHDSYIYTMYGVGIEFFRVMINLLNNVSQSEYKTTATIMPYLIGLIFSLGLISSIDFGVNYFMIPLVLGVAYFFVFVYMYFNMKKILDIKYDFNIIKVISLSSPFFMVYFIQVSHLNILYNLALTLVFGLYFLFIIWLLRKQSLAGEI
jgi:O-antigen/teichoic acid export membrane protein